MGIQNINQNSLFINKNAYNNTLNSFLQSNPNESIFAYSGNNAANNNAINTNPSSSSQSGQILFKGQPELIEKMFSLSKSAENVIISNGVFMDESDYSSREQYLASSAKSGEKTRLLGSIMREGAIVKDRYMGQQQIIGIMRFMMPHLSSILTPVKFKERNIADNTEAALEELFKDCYSLNIKDAEFEEKMELLNDKSETVLTEFADKFSILETLVDMAPKLISLRDQGAAGEESGLDEIVNGLINGIDESKPNYNNAKDKDSLNKSFASRIKNMYGKNFAPDKLDEKIKEMEKKQKTLQDKLNQAKFENKPQDIEKYSKLLEANQIGLELLLIVKTQMEAALINIESQD